MQTLKIPKQDDGPEDLIGKFDEGKIQNLLHEVESYMDKTALPLYKEMRFQDFLGRSLRQLEAFQSQLHEI